MRHLIDIRSNSQSRAISAFMSRVYLWMMVGICISGLTAFTVASRPDVVLYITQHSFVFFGLIIAQIASVLVLSSAVQRMSITLASTIFALYATLVGLTFSSIFLVYQTSSISTAFFVTAASFGGLSIFGYTTQRDLGPVGAFCTMGLFGLIAVGLLSLFFPSMMSNTMQLTYSTIGVLIFAGLTAYDTQKIKSMHFQYTNGEQARRGAIACALILYLDFINLFLNILRLMGDRR